MRQPLKLRGYSFSEATIDDYRLSGKLLSLRLETNYDCNLACKYCYAPEIKKMNKNILSYKEQIEVIDQAKDMGIQSVVIVGPGEPLLFSHLKELVEYLSNNSIIPVIFSNLTLMTKELAKYLYEHNVSIIGKLDGSKEIQDKLCGDNVYDLINKGLEELLRVGYADLYDTNTTRLGLGCVVCSVNYKEIPALWRSMRARKIFPNFEQVTTIGRADNSLDISISEKIDLINTLREIDEKEYKIEWKIPYSPIPAFQCCLFYVGTHLNLYGGICPCPELPPIDSIRNNSLSSILKSEEYNRIRKIEQHLQGKCADCIYNNYCYGCRSKAFRKYGSIFAEDPSCPMLYREVIV